MKCGKNFKMKPGSSAWRAAGGWIFLGFILTAAAYEMTDEDFSRKRDQMVTGQIQSRGVMDPEVIAAMRRVPRHFFVPKGFQHLAYEDHPLEIGHGQTISQPYIVGLMSQLLGTARGDKVLEIGTGSGYQAAVLAEMGTEVYTIEIVEALARRAEEALQSLGYKNVQVRAGDGYQGWPEHAPYDGIIVTAAPEEIPQPLIDQLKKGGTMVVPVGPAGNIQRLMLIRKEPDGTLTRTALDPVRFVPMVRES